MDNIHEGKFQKGKRWKGLGKEFYSLNKLEYEGEYGNGKRNEKGKEFSKDGILTFEGKFQNGKDGKGKEKNILMGN